VALRAATWDAGSAPKLLAVTPPRFRDELNDTIVEPTGTVGIELEGTAVVGTSDVVEGAFVVGVIVGVTVVGTTVDGTIDGVIVGISDGTTVGTTVGTTLGIAVGIIVGTDVYVAPGRHIYE